MKNLDKIIVSKALIIYSFIWFILGYLLGKYNK